MKRVCTDSENKLLQEYFQKRFNIVGLEDCCFEVNGGVVYDISFSSNGNEVWYFEEDFRDDEGNLYIIKRRMTKTFENAKKGSRLIIVSKIGGKPNMDFFVAPIDGTTWELVGAQSILEIDKIDISRCKAIPDKLVFNLTEGVMETSQDTFKRIKRLKGIKKQSKINKTVLIFLIGLLVTIFVGLAYIFTVANMNRKGLITGWSFMAVSIFYLLLLIGGMVGDVFLERRLSFRQPGYRPYYIQMFLESVFEYSTLVNFFGSTRDIIVISGFIKKDGEYERVTFNVDKCFIRLEKSNSRIVNVYLKKYPEKLPFYDNPVISDL